MELVGGLVIHRHLGGDVGAVRSRQDGGVDAVGEVVTDLRTEHQLGRHSAGAPLLARLDRGCHIGGIKGQAHTLAEGIDQALKLGLNLPRGPFEIAALHGSEKIAATLAELDSKAPAHLKSRYLQPA